MLPRRSRTCPTRLTRLLAIADTTVYTQQTAKALLLFSFRHKIAIGRALRGLGEGRRAVCTRLGLPTSSGMYCGALALRALQSRRRRAPLLPRPRVFDQPAQRAELLRLNWDMSLLRGVDRAFE